MDRQVTGRLVDNYKSRVIDIIMEFDATRAIEYHPPIPLRPVEAARRRGQVARSIRACEACNLRGGCHQPVPFTGPREPLFVVLGEAPDQIADTKNRNGVGPGSRMLRALMQDVGIDGDDALWLNTVSCWPNKAGKSRPPTETEQALCRENMLAQLALSGCTYVLMTGASALSCFRSDLKISKVHGQVFVWLGTYAVMPVHHPLGALRNPSLKIPLRESLQTFGDLLLDNPLLHLGEDCIKCGMPVDQYDPDGVGYCNVHWSTALATYRRQLKRWKKTRWENMLLLDPREYEVKKPIRRKAKGE